MVDKKSSLDDAFEAREEARKVLGNCNKYINEKLKPLVESVLASGMSMSSEEVTKRVNLLYDSRYELHDVSSLLARMAEKKEVISSNGTYRRNSFEKMAQ
ncbi:hypothetical protein HYX16_03575 [Candidatus Woesearchaeota archaeon]|nr:hypothetical protein [Candidatus Woesearchaeota archaeon]